MDNFRRASLYVKELPINARELSSSDINSTYFKAIYIPDFGLANVPSSWLGAYTSYNYGMKFYTNNKIEYNGYCYGSGLISNVTGYFDIVNRNTRLEIYYSATDYISGYGTVGVYYQFLNDWNQQGYTDHRSHPYTLSLQNSSSYITPIHSSECFDENIDINNPIYIKVDVRAISPHYTAGLAKFTTASSGISPYKIYIEPVE